VDIASWVHLVRMENGFRSHETWRARDRPALLDARLDALVVLDLGPELLDQAEVEDFHEIRRLNALVQHQVRRLDVAVDQPTRVGFGECTGGLLEDADDASGRLW